METPRIRSIQARGMKLATTRRRFDMRSSDVCTSIRPDQESCRCLGFLHTQRTRTQGGSIVRGDLQVCRGLLYTSKNADVNNDFVTKLVRLVGTLPPMRQYMVRVAGTSGRGRRTRSTTTPSLSSSLGRDWGSSRTDAAMRSRLSCVRAPRLQF